jgi:hypothetical protein
MPSIQDAIITPALAEIRVARAGDVLAPDDAAFALIILNSILDLWNADDRALYTVNFYDFTFTPNVSPHTIGPAGSVAGPTNPNFVVTQRPKSLKYAATNLGSSPNVFTPITVRDDAWYQAQTVPGLTQTFPTDVWYSPDWVDPNGLGTGYGNLYFWGIPTTAYGVRLWLEFLLGQVALTDTFSLPQGYQRALWLTLAEEAAMSFGQVVPPSLTARASLARGVVFSNNDFEPSLATADAGLNRTSGRQTWNYHSRSYT